MPYWDELSYTALPASHTGFPTVFLQEACFQRTFRSRNGKGRVLNTLVPDNVAEPYTHYDGVNTLKRDAYRRRFGNDGALRPDRGHAWKMIRYDRSSPPFSWRQTHTNGNDYSSSNVNFGSGSASWMVPAFTDQSSALDAYAKQQFTKAAPTSDNFNLATFLGELREGLVSLAFLKRSSFRDIERLLYGVRPGDIVSTSKDALSTSGKNFLGYEFGVLPLVSDLRDMGMALYKATSALTGFNTPIHRRREKVLAANVATTDKGASFTMSTRGTNFVPGLDTQLKRDFPSHVAGGRSTTTTLLGDAWSGSVENTRMWYEAEYVLVPKIGFDPSSYLDRLETLMNTDFTLSVLWELAPWSWLADWALKIGDSISANELASSNRLVTNYAYAMCEQKVTQVLTISNIRGNPAATGYSYFGLPSSYVSTQSLTVKQRIRANPFGFNPVSSSITRNEQWAILGALAASKGL